MFKFWPTVEICYHICSPHPHSHTYSTRSACVSARSLNHVQLFATPWTVVLQLPLSLRFSKQQSWSRLPFPPPGDMLRAQHRPRPRVAVTNFPEQLVTPPTPPPRPFPCPVSTAVTCSSILDFVIPKNESIKIRSSKF